MILLLSIVLVSGFGALLGREYRRHRAALAALPPRSPLGDRSTAGLVAILGTGSMAPYIPASTDPRQIVAYCALDRTPYDALATGELVIYREVGAAIVHQLAQRDAAGWRVSGLHNARYDRARVTPENYLGRVTHTYLV